MARQRACFVSICQASWLERSCIRGSRTMPLIPETKTQESAAPPIVSRNRWLVLLVVGLGMVAGVLSSGSFNVAVPSLTRAFNLGQDQVQWAMTGFMAAMTVAMLPTPWLLERFSFRRVFLAALVVMALGSCAGYLAPSFQLVVAARIVQGLAAGVLQPLGPIALMRLFPPAIQGRAMGVLSFSIALTPSISPALGGFLLDRFGWSSIFLLNLPFCVVAFVAAFYLLRQTQPVSSKPFDWLGLCVLTVGTIAAVEAVSSLQHSGPFAPWTLFQFGIGIAAIRFYIGHARRKPAPIIQLGLLQQRTFALGTVVAFIYGFGLYASSYLIPVFLQNALAYPASDAGMALLPSGFMLVITMLIAGRMVDRFPPKWLMAAGQATFAISCFLLAIRGGSISYAELIAATVLGRIGVGLVTPAMSLAIMRHLQPHELGQSSAISSYARQLGGVIGIAISAVFVEWRETLYGRIAPGVFSAYAQAFLLLGAVLFTAFVAACLMRAETHPHTLMSSNID